LNIDLWS